jgi:RNA polymerase sigma factor (sigma-70 family)
MNGGQQSDEELARLAAGGDERAFSDLYNRYFPEVYDYAIRISRDRDIAALVLQSSFLRLHQALQSGTPPPSVKLQLFVGAHHDLAERVRRRRSLVMEGEEAFVAPDPDRLGRPLGGAELHELTRVAWQAARELRPEDYELLDLSVRRNLSDEEIAAAVRTRPQTVQARLDRARAMFEDSFSSHLLLLYGRRACLELDFLVAEDKWSSSLRRRIFHHLAACQICQGTRRAYPSAADVLASIGVAPAPPGWQAIMLSRLLKAREGGDAQPSGPLLPGRPAAPMPALDPLPAPAPEVAAPAASARSGYSTGRPPADSWGQPGFIDRFSDWSGGRGPLVAVFGGGLLIVLMIFGGLCGAGAFDSGSTNKHVTVTPTRTVKATRTRTPTVTATLTATETPPPEKTPTEEPPTLVPTDTPFPLQTSTPAPAQTNTPPPLPTATP